MKILHVLSDVKVPVNPDVESSSGLVHACLQIAARQADRGHDVTVWFSSAVPRHARWRGVTLTGVVPWPWARVPLSRRTMDFSRHGPLLLQTFRRPYDVVHAHGFAYLRGVRARLRFVHFHSDPAWGGLTERDYARLARDVDGVLAVNHVIAETVKARVTPFPPVYPVPVAPSVRLDGESVAHPLTVRARLGIPADGFALLYAGAILREKGVAELLEAFEKLPQGADGPFLLIAGSSSLWGTADNRMSPYEKECRRFVVERRLSLRVRWLGLLNRPQLWSTYRAADAVIIPSQWPEPAPLVLLDSLSLGVPVIATAVGGIPEYLDGGGLLVEPVPDSMARGITSLRRHPELRRQLASAGSVRAETWSWERTVQELDKIYHLPRGRIGAV